jgi:hypothetical protein
MPEETASEKSALERETSGTERRGNRETWTEKWRRKKVQREGMSSLQARMHTKQLSHEALRGKRLKVVEMLSRANENNGRLGGSHGGQSTTTLNKKPFSSIPELTERGEGERRGRARES